MLHEALEKPTFEEEDESDESDDEGGIIISFGTSTNPNATVQPNKNCLKQGSNPVPSAPLVSVKEASPPKFMLERKLVTKVPTVASEKELQDILENRSNDFKKKMKSLDPRKARALRRKLYLDLYGEVAQRMLI